MGGVRSFFLFLNSSAKERVEMTVVYICIYLGRGLGRHGAVLFTRVFAFSTQCTLSYPLLAWPSKSRLLRTVTSFKLTKSYATYLHT